MFLFSSMLSISIIMMLISMFMIMFNTFISIKISLINLFSLFLSLDMLLDWVSLLFMSTVMFISSMIVMFSMYYIPKLEQKMFLNLLLMFILSMMILILSNNIFLILLGWDGLGLSSYILVVYYQDFTSNASGSITLLSNRVGDILILISISMLFMMSNWNFSMNWEIPYITLILLTIAACSKSAQFPFSAWLPMAMAAPTPISALVHSSTLVTAGVFILIRITSIVHSMTLMMLMILSTMTALYSSLSANWEQDMKKIIALSTLSQIAMMMFAISMNAIILTFLHLVIHALFKSTMFLCAGTMIHESSYQDMRMISMNYINNPLTLSTMGITNMALMGIPFMSGFFSKDAIIENLIASKLKSILSIMMISSIGMTAMYSLRMTFLSNKMNLKSQPKTLNHSIFMNHFPLIMLAPMTILSGSFLSWVLNSEQIFILTFNIKMIIIFSLLIGILLGFLFSFKNNKYHNLGKFSLSLWSIHFFTTIYMKNLSPLMSIYSYNDKMWQEMYGPTHTFNFFKKITNLMNFPKLSPMMMSIMVMMIPLMLFM